MYKINPWILTSFLWFQILTVAVLSILIFAPLGAVAITILAPRLLSSTPSTPAPPSEKQKESVPDTVIPMYEQNSSYTSYGIKDDHSNSTSPNNEENSHQNSRSSEENNRCRSSNLSSENIRNKASSSPKEETNGNVYTIEKLWCWMRCLRLNRAVVLLWTLLEINVIGCIVRIGYTTASQNLSGQNRKNPVVRNILIIIITYSVTQYFLNCLKFFFFIHLKTVYEQ